MYILVVLGRNKKPCYTKSNMARYSYIDNDSLVILLFFVEIQSLLCDGWVFLFQGV